MWATLHPWDWSVSWRTVEALRQIGDVLAVKDLLAALHSGNFQEGEAAARALGEIETLEVLKRLCCRLDIDIYHEEIYPIIRRLAITFSSLHPQPASLPIYPQHLFLRLFNKGLWWMKIFGSVLSLLGRVSDQSLHSFLNELRQKRR